MCDLARGYLARFRLCLHRFLPGNPQKGPTDERINGKINLKNHHVFAPYFGVVDPLHRPRYYAICVRHEYRVARRHSLSFTGEYLVQRPHALIYTLIQAVLQALPPCFPLQESVPRVYLTVGDNCR